MKIANSYNKAAFTLIEIMIVVAIIAVLASIAIPSFVAYRNLTRRNTCHANIGMLNRATEAYIINNNLANNAEVSLSSLAPESRNSVRDTIKGDYFLKYKPECPAGGEYQYSTDTQSWRCSICGE